MLKKGKTKFITDFLIPSLNSEIFGNQLKWLDKENSIFQLGWCHKGVPDWSEIEAQVFVEWDKMKGHYQPNEKNYFTNSKQRFRALLNKLTLEAQLKKIKSDIKFKKVYSITGVKKKLKRKKHSSKAGSTDDMPSANNEMPPGDANGDEMNKLSNASDEWADVAFGRTRDQLELTESAWLTVNRCINNLSDHNYSQCLIHDSAKKHNKEHRKDIQKSIPTPITIRHTTVVPEPSSYEESDSSPSSPECCATYDGFDETDLELSYEYYRALNASCEQRMQDKDLFKSAIRTLRIVKVEEDGG